MYKRILYASVSVQEEEQARDLQFDSGINILRGQNAEDAVLTLAGIFGGMPPKSFQAVLNWRDDAILLVSGYDGCVFVDGIKNEKTDPVQLLKEFHKQRFLTFRNTAHLLDGTQLPAGTSGATNLLLAKLHDTLAKEDGRPLFVCNFLERLDEAVDLKSVFDTLTATGRQVFIAVPHYYNIKLLEEMHYDIHTL